MRGPLIFLLGVFLNYSIVDAQNIEVKKYYQGQNTLKEVYHVTDTNSHILHGSFKSYYANGKIKTMGRYEDNKPTGLWEYFFENGALKMKGNINPDNEIGYWQYFFENGNKNMEGVFIKGKRVSNWKFYYERGGLKREGEFVAGKRNGNWTYYNEDGTIKAEAEYKDDKGLYKEFYSSGDLKAMGMNHLGKSDSLWVYYYENRNLKAKGNYKNGLKEGHWKYYNEDGIITSEGDYKNGLTDGNWMHYHENGQVSSEGIEKQGVKEGYWKLYHKSGVFKGESTFLRGEGPYKEYYESGKLKITGFVKDEKNHGKWLYYYEDGNLEGECEFKDGIGQFKGYYKSGRLRMTGTIKDGVNVGLWKLYKDNGDLAGYYTTVYNDGQPQYKEVSMESDTTTVSGEPFYEIPAFLFRSKKARYFRTRINEFKGIIIATNPLEVIIGSIPFSVEYYIQERLGYELLFNYKRSPFFTSDSNVPFNELYKRGYAIKFKQKFYHRDGKLGMFYFGHEVVFTANKYSSNINNPTLPTEFFTIEAKENRYEYALFIGDRLMKYAGKPGITLDIQGGVGIGYRHYNEKFPSLEAYRNIFSKINKTKLSVPFYFSINLGYAF